VAVLLDLDGTVLDNSGLPEVAARTCASVSQAIGGIDPDCLFEANAEAWAQHWPEVEKVCWLGQLDGRAASREAWRRALERCGCVQDAAVDLAVADYRSFAREAFLLYPDVRGFLDYAAERGLRLGLVTNGPSDMQRDKIEGLGIGAEIPVVVISAEHGVAKPDPAVFGIALDELGVRPQDAWCVGDSLDTDVAGALAAGVTAIWLNRSAHHPPTSAVAPDIELNSMSGLTTLLRAV
jgi:HAD superfamily hydrolase (TIGR01549 family)